MTVLLPLWETAGPGSLLVTPPGLGTSRTGHASRARGGRRDAARQCISLVLRAPTPAKPGSACEPTKPAGSRKPEEPLGRLRLAPLLGTRSGHGGRGEGGSRAGRQGTAPTDRAAPHNGSWASPHGVLRPPRGATGAWEQAEQRGRAGSMPATPLDQGVLCLLHPRIGVLGNGGP